MSRHRARVRSWSGPAPTFRAKSTRSWECSASSSCRHRRTATIAFGFEKLQVHLDNLRLMLDALPDGADETSVKILRDTIENQIRDSLTWSIATSMVIARIEARQAGE
jgi:hypothetical protein